MQFSQIFTIAAIAGSAIATPAQAYNSGLQKRTCWELTGTALTICQDACKIACEAASFGLAGTACASACTLANLKRELDGADSLPVPTVQAVTVNNAVTVTNLDVQNNTIALKIDSSVGRTACVVACEVTCNSTVLALIQTKCLEECKALCPSE